MLKDLNLNYLDSGYFNVKVKPKYTTMQGYSNDYTFTGVIAATASALLGKITVSSGSFLFPVMAKNEDVDIEIKNDSYLPSTFTSLVWLGDFNVRGQ